MLQSLATCLSIVLIAGTLTTGCATTPRADLLTIFHTTDSPLTSIVDSTAEVCEVTSACTHALTSDQAQILEFATTTAATHELTATDDIIAGRYLVRWTSAEAAAITGDTVTRTLQLGRVDP